MLSETQVRNLNALHARFASEPDVGPVDPPRVGERYHCGGGRPYWLRDVSALRFAERLAVQTDPRCRRRQRILGIPVGRRLNALMEHYGLTPDQIRTIVEIDDLPIPDSEHGGRQVWIERHQQHIREVIALGTASAPPPAYVNHIEPVETLLVAGDLPHDDAAAGHSPEMASVR